MGEAALPIAMAGSVLSASGQMQQGNAAYAAGIGKQQAADYQAAALDQKATQVVGEGSQQVAIDTLNTQATLSKARAMAAASGGSATAPTVIGIEGQIAARGEYNAMSALYSAKDQALGLQNQASLDIYEGQQYAAAGRAEQQAGKIKAFSTVLSGVGGLAAKYGSGFTAAGSGGFPSGISTASDVTGVSGYNPSPSNYTG